MVDELVKVAAARIVDGGTGGKKMDDCMLD